MDTSVTPKLLRAYDLLRACAKALGKVIGDQLGSCELMAADYDGMLSLLEELQQALPPLTPAPLDAPCHADALLEMANTPLDGAQLQSVAAPADRLTRAESLPNKLEDGSQ